MTQLLRPWVFPFVLAYGCVGVLAMATIVASLPILRGWDSVSISESQIRLERQAEVLSAVVSTLVFAMVSAVVLLVLGSEQMTHMIAGAMCAYGVISSSPYGFYALVAGLLSALGLSVWWVVHRLDLDVEQPVLVLPKLYFLLALSPLLCFAVLSGVAYALDLDFKTVTSCCAAGVDVSPSNARYLHMGANSFSALGWAVAGVGTIVTLCSIAWRRPEGVVAYMASLMTFCGGIAAMWSVIHYVAPHVYEAPTHQCPFCLLNKDAHWIGWPLFIAAFVGMVFGVSLGALEYLKRMNPSVVSAPARAMQEKLAFRACVAWTSVAMMAAFPVVTFMLRNGGHSVFGI